MIASVDWLMWAPLAAATLHISEEFVIPGGFPAWYRQYRSDPSRITPRFLVIANTALLIACCNVGAIGRNVIGISYWMTMSAVLCSNGIWHAWASYKSHSYSPGVVTGMLIYVPLAVYGYSEFLRSGAVPIWAAAIACLIGRIVSLLVGHVSRSAEEGVKAIRSERRSCAGGGCSAATKY